ncbi:Hsp20/alpha crystallin family protein [Natroniella acetigena]|uniref:Hsp20/alpha crystallin family protein n=1 Tax=Natroniella acetigena TaxID=52004 RepID=UPI00200AB3CA|nr:Hsp20/alpha crystallin family protein [Natroniella acetigena]MCK8827570.1 Hsp20/alpha crystallin family protein [Natroniella acetigena]
MKSNTWNPFREINTIREQMNRFLDERLPEQEKTYPAVDIYEEGDNLVIKADLPGIRPDDVEIMVSEETVIVKGQHQEQESTKGQNGYYYEERSRNEFQRRITLPLKVKHQEARADIEHGVMEIIIPKAEEELNKVTRLKLNNRE